MQIKKKPPEDFVKKYFLKSFAKIHRKNTCVGVFWVWFKIKKPQRK